MANHMRYKLTSARSRLNPISSNPKAQIAAAFKLLRKFILEYKLKRGLIRHAGKVLS